VSNIEYQIKAVAELSGFSPSTLRYYEEIGLLTPSSRTPAGYRMYDQEAIDRLAFISRAKQLGCTLEEITDLTSAWTGGQCGPLQDRLRTVVDTKLFDAQRQIDELTTLRADLHRVAEELQTHRPVGPCDDRCGCVSSADSKLTQVRPQTVLLTTKPSLSKRVSTKVAIPIACTLTASDLTNQLADWEQLLAHATDRSALPGGLRLTFSAETPMTELVRLVAAEQACCQFFEFAITVDQRGLALEVRAPEDASEIVNRLFARKERI
jgi:MerR family transcriptional regulator, copper efflux regulator